MALKHAPIFRLANSYVFGTGGSVQVGDYLRQLRVLDSLLTGQIVAPLFESFLQFLMAMIFRSLTFNVIKHEMCCFQANVHIFCLILAICFHKEHAAWAGASLQ